MKETKEENEER